MTESRRGLIFGFAAYTIWGAFPLYFPLLKPSSPVEILAHRIVWSALVMTLLVFALRRRTALRDLLRDRRTTLLLLVSAATITANWGTYIYGVNSERVVETSLGYFINPLVTVLMGVFILGERLRPLQWAALGLAAGAVLVLTLDYGRLPWVALVLAFSFGSYGLAKKKANTGSVESLTVETLLLTPIAMGYIAWLMLQGTSNFGHAGSGHVALTIGTGIVTAIPLICFGAAATRVSMTAIGLMQYLTPTIQFLLGVLVFDEPMPTLRWVGFILIWIALAIFTFELVHHRRRQQLALTAGATAL